MKLLVLAALLAVGVTASSAGAASQPLVPAFTQHQIAKQEPMLAYVPARLATGYRYYRWTGSGMQLRIWFRNGAKKEIVFVVELHRDADCAAGKTKTFQLAGNKVYWAQTDSGQVAWRCVLNGHIHLSALTSQPPTKFADVGLGRVAASGHKIR